MPSFGVRSKQVRSEIHPDLQNLVDHVVMYQDIALLTGHRTKDEQMRVFEAGRSKVKWPNSKHNHRPALAVDLVPWPLPMKWGDLTEKGTENRDWQWKERVKFYQLYGFVRAIWSHLADTGRVSGQYKLRWGGDWDGDGEFNDQSFDDLIHYELSPYNS